MSQRTSRSALLASTMLLGVGLPSLAVAQEADDEIIVTGSRIPSANAVSSSPVTTIGNVEFDIRGTTRVEDLVNTLPQAFAAQGANTSNGATGTAQVSLRGLGANRTLVLINGRRMQYGSPISSAPDLNQIPGALVERVDVLTGGASAVYGSDAIAGVVNFIMMQDFEGVRIDAQLSGYQHGNNNQAAQDRLIAAQPPAFGSDLSIPESGVFDGKGQEITLIVGANTEDGRGNVTAYAGYRNNDAILQADRDYSKCAYAGGDPDFGCAGSSTTPAGRFFTGVGSGDYTLDENVPGTFRPRTGSDTFNYNPTNFYQRPDERYTLGAFAHYEANRHLDFYLEAMFYDYTSDAQIAFTGTFFTTNAVNCDNPLISNVPNAAGFSQLDYICGVSDPGVDGILGTNDNGTPGDTSDDFNDDPGLPIAGSGSTTAGDVTFYPGKRFVEGNPRNNSIRNQSYRIVGGVRGEAFEGWNYDTYFQYGTTRGSNTYDNDGVIPNMQDALFAVSDGMGGVQCRSASARAQGCVPLNLFTPGGVNQAQLDYVLLQSFQLGATKQYVGEASLTGDLGQYGFKTPWAETGVGISFGAQWRKDKLEYNPDSLFELGLLSGQGGPTPPTSGEIETTDFYVESKIPLAEGMAFAESLVFEGGYRHSDVSTSGSYSTWKLLGDWQITPELRVRGGWQRAARAANVIESFTPQAIGLTQIEDGCAVGAANPYTAAGCANTNGGAPLAPGSIPNNPADQYNALFGGNPNLDPEVSDTYTVGVVLTPGDYVPGNLFVSVDYFDITVEGFVGIVNPQTALDQCAANNDPFFCSLVNRAPNGSLWITPQGFITATNVNTGSLSTSGLDINANWSFDFADVGMGSAGGIAFDLVGTYLLDLNTFELPDGTVPEYDCAGFYGSRCGSPNPEWRHKLRTTWQSPFGVDASVTWRYFSSVVHGDSVSGPRSALTDLDYKLGSRNYIDLAASYNVTEKWNVTVGVNNLLDKDPPLTSQTAGFSNGNTYPQTYDAQGRYIFLGTTIDF
ncbi:MAG: TonB-dependent receptor [Parvularculaceae bacterium]|nr:TonB-dependent receptor [Parvularculaceae bacterium]